MINHKFSLDKSFQEIFYRIDNWVNEGSGWIVELIKSPSIKISTYRPLSGRSYIKLPDKSKIPKKDLINIKNNDQKCFLRCHVRHINPVKTHPERTTLENKKLVNRFDHGGVGFPVRENDFSKIEKNNNICINVFYYESKLTFPI